VIFCTAGLRIDEQEATRFLLLSPDASQEKIREAIYEKIRKETDSASYRLELDRNEARRQLKERIRAIRDEKIGDIRIDGFDKVSGFFLAKNRMLKPRDTRDVAR